MFCDSTYTQKATDYWTGDVLAVTPRGGIRVRITEHRDGGWQGPGTGRDAGTVRWIPYSWVNDWNCRR